MTPPSPRPQLPLRRPSVRVAGLLRRGMLTLARLPQWRERRRPLPPAVPLGEVLRGESSPMALSRVVEARGNAARQAAVAAWLESRGVPFVRYAGPTPEGLRESFAVDVGSGDRVVLLIAHHDAVPGSPGANDNGAAIGVLLHLLPRLHTLVRPGRRVRLLFSAAEELGYLGTRAYAQATGGGDLVGVISMELCGIGETVALWDAAVDTPFLRRVTGTLTESGFRTDETLHVVGRIPGFGSDHRVFAATGIPAYGLTAVPHRAMADLRRFVFQPLRYAATFMLERPAPFDTYHNSRDRGPTLQPAALDSMVRAVSAIVAGA
jgi:hypothetical protein